MKSLFRYIIFLILLNFSFAAKAESIYPIQLYAAMLPPYTNCLGDYINGDMNRLKLSAVVRDMSKHGSTMSISVLMRVKSGNTVYLETTTPVQQIINVQGAMVDIRTENLFTSYDNNAKNLVGRGSFMSNGYCLPEGAYEFVYQVFDGTNKKLPLSEPISIYCFLNQAEPPVGVTPLDGECLDSKTTPNIVFSWMDAVAIGPKYREYSVEVKEQNGAMLASQEGLLPMFGAQSEVNNFTVVTEKSYNTNTLIMQNTSSKFQEGKTYLWRVRAVPTKVNGNADENFAYKNDGYSEWMSFKYGGCGDSVVIPKADSIDMNLRVDMTTVDTSEETGSVVVHWQDIFDNTEVDKYCAYELYVYKADNESAAKTIIPIKDGETKEYTFDNLERGETYKSYIVGLTGCGTPDTIRTPHSDTVSFKLKKPESDSCMVNIDPAKCGKDDLIETLEKGSTFTANDHNVIVTITECKAGSVAGSFTGKGIVSCTIFKDKIGLNVEFEDILVNKSKELCMGTVKVITSEENNLLVNLNDLSGKKRTAPKAPSQDYPYTKKVATLEELNKNVEQYKGEVVLVGDNEIYAVGNNGEVEKIGKVVDNACRPSTHSMDNSAGLVVFDVDEKYNEGKWTPYIDKSPSPFSYAQIVNGYERIGSYVVPWVSMVQGEARYIKATIQGKTKTTGTGLSGMEKDIKFYCVTDSVMTELNSEYKDGAFKVKVFGGQPDRKLTIVAMMNSTGTADECAKNSKTIGETNIYTMSYRKKTIHLVPVCMDVTGEKGDPKTYADKINKVFAPLGRSYEFKFENKFENDAVKSLIANGLNTEDGGNVFNNKTPEMKQLCRLYKHDENVKIDHRADAYVFLLDQNTNSKIKGYMPRTNSEGFVFTKGMTVEDIAETMTHELCHGLYGLEHTFSYGIDTMALPENIMSYSTQIGRRPSKYFQWYNIENPSEYHFPFTDSAEDGEWTTDGHYYLFTYIGVLLGLKYKVADQYGKWAEEPDTHVNPDGSMAENTTWLYGKLQQQNHALTGGFHGLELAATAYAIVKAKNNPSYLANAYVSEYKGTFTDYKNCNEFLFHRFGDCFAHCTSQDNENEILTNLSNHNINLQSYVSFIDEYSKSICVNNSNLEKNKIYYYVNERKLISTKTVEETSKLIVDNIVHSTDFEVVFVPSTDDKGNQYYTFKEEGKGFKSLLKSIDSNLEGNDVKGPNFQAIKKNVKDYVKNAMKNYVYVSTYDVLCNLMQNRFTLEHNRNRMYGDAVKCKETEGEAFSNGHGWASKQSDWFDVGVNPDNIVQRRALFLYYTSCIIDLYSMLYGFIGSKVMADTYERIRTVVDFAAIAFAIDEGIKIKNSRLDAIFAFLIQYDQWNKKGDFVFSYPIKYLDTNLYSGHGTVGSVNYSDWEKQANSDSNIEFAVKQTRFELNNLRAYLEFIVDQGIQEPFVQKLNLNRERISTIFDSANIVVGNRHANMHF